MIAGLVLADGSWSGSLPSAAPPAAAPGTLTPPPVDVSLGGSQLGPLALVCVLLLAALLLLRYLRLIRRPAQDGLLSVVAQTSLSQQHTVYLVQAAGRYLLLGGAPGGLSLLGELPASTLPPPARPGVAPRRGDAQRSVTDDEEDEAEEDMPAMVARPPAPTSQQAGPKGP